MTEQFGRASLAVIPLRAEASHRSEMTSQLLLGEPYSIIQSVDGWLKIRCLWDDYEGWICSNQHTQCTSSEAQKALAPEGFAWDFAGEGRGSFGTPVYDLAGLENTRTIGNCFFSDSIADLSLVLLNVPYLWGGRSEYGIDCSGLVQLVSRALGRKLPRDAWQQAECVKKIEFGAHQKDDLAFFVNQHNKITHVGVVLSPTSIIHASGHVRVDNLNPQGIFTRDTSIQTHTLGFIGTLN